MDFNKIYKCKTVREHYFKTYKYRINPVVSSRIFSHMTGLPTKGDDLKLLKFEDSKRQYDILYSSL